MEKEIYRRILRLKSEKNVILITFHFSLINRFMKSSIIPVKVKLPVIKKHYP